jgi:hypothetical protein
MKRDKQEGPPISGAFLLAPVLHFYSGQPLQNLSGVDTASFGVVVSVFLSMRYSSFGRLLLRISGRDAMNVVQYLGSQFAEPTGVQRDHLRLRYGTPYAAMQHSSAEQSKSMSGRAVNSVAKVRFWANRPSLDQCGLARFSRR